MTFVDDDVAVLVLGRTELRRSMIAKLQTVLEAALNREVQVVEPRGEQGSAVSGVTLDS